MTKTILKPDVSLRYQAKKWPRGLIIPPTQREEEANERKAAGLWGKSE